ncbi:hypothetical protein [Marinococcus luteus]|uniref:hypothetical protein n=1 Tax=Marinococcus luteus TaxID=1122204 RepID=UPI002ACCB66B|nr:hypothetical protein [Marinococcus luteus]MDZ5781888.1 hypothetical protein [Marinococcus luteus]
MLGSRRADLELANNFYSTPINVEFINIEQGYVEKLIRALKELKSEVSTYYDGDLLLVEETETFIKVCRNVVGTLSNYSIYFHEQNEIIVRYFTLLQKKIYIDLFNKKIEPIIALIKILRKLQSNAYIDALSKLINERSFTLEETYILTKKERLNNFFKLKGRELKKLSAKEFIDLGIFAENIIFIGTPGYFDRKFSEIFYGKNIIFLGYSCFENRIVRNNSFSDLINQDFQINTIYKDVTFVGAHAGLEYEEIFVIENSEEAIISRFKNKEVLFEDKIEVKLATISNKNYVFLPVLDELNIIDKETLKVSQVKVENLTIGDLLLFRNYNGSNLIKETANKIMASKAEVYRESTRKWKEELNLGVKKYGIKNFSKILKDEYKISIANEQNIKNWTSKYSIKPSCLKALLTALKFSEKDKEEVLNATDEILKAHISAGRLISQSLMNELNENLESLIEENGFFKFKSKEFKGAYFNIEEIIKISSETIFVSENEVLKVIKK